MFVIIKLELGLLSIDNIYNGKINILEVNDINVSWNNNIFINVNVYMGLGDYEFNIYYNLYVILIETI